MLMEESLILLIPGTEILEELVSQFHDLLHSDILTLVHITHRLIFYLQYFNGKLLMCKTNYAEL